MGRDTVVRSGDLRVRTRGLAAAGDEVLDVGDTVDLRGPDAQTDCAIEARDVWGQECWVVIRAGGIDALQAVPPAGVPLYDFDGRLRLD